MYILSHRHAPNPELVPEPPLSQLLKNQHPALWLFPLKYVLGEGDRYGSVTQRRERERERAPQSMREREREREQAITVTVITSTLYKKDQLNKVKYLSPSNPLWLLCSKICWKAVNRPSESSVDQACTHLKQEIYLHSNTGGVLTASAAHGQRN